MEGKVIVKGGINKDLYYQTEEDGGLSRMRHGIRLLKERAICAKTKPNKGI